MGTHLRDGEFQSDKYPTCPAGKVPLSTKDPMAQDLLLEYARRRRAVDPEFADDLEEALKLKGYPCPTCPDYGPRTAFKSEIAQFQAGAPNAGTWFGPCPDGRYHSVECPVAKEAAEKAAHT